MRAPTVRCPGGTPGPGREELNCQKFHIANFFQHYRTCTCSVIVIVITAGLEKNFLFKVQKIDNPGNIAVIPRTLACNHEKFQPQISIPKILQDWKFWVGLYYVMGVYYVFYGLCLNKGMRLALKLHTHAKSMHGHEAPPQRMGTRPTPQCVGLRSHLNTWVRGHTSMHGYEAPIPHMGTRPHLHAWARDHTSMHGYEVTPPCMGTRPTSSSMRCSTHLRQLAMSI